LADIGEGIDQVEILQWYAKEGDVIQEFDPLCEVQSDKATVPIKSPFAGKITKLYYKVCDYLPFQGPVNWSLATGRGLCQSPQAPNGHRH